MDVFKDIIALVFFPAGLAVIVGGLAYEWIDRKLVAQLQNRIGPRWFQPAAGNSSLPHLEASRTRSIHP